VLKQPGFLWCRRLKLAEKGSYAMIYGIESRAPFEARMRIERFAGEVDFSL